MKKFVVLIMCIILACTPVFAANTNQEPDRGIFGFFQDATDFVAEKAGEVGNALQGAVSTVGETFSNWFQPKQSGSGVGDFFSNLGQGISDFAGQASETISSVTSNFATQAVDAFTNAENYVSDGVRNIFSASAVQNA